MISSTRLIASGPSLGMMMQAALPTVLLMNGVIIFLQLGPVDVHLNLMTVAAREMSAV